VIAALMMTFSTSRPFRRSATPRIHVKVRAGAPQTVHGPPGTADIL
jgi:hypothetical protein